MQAWRQYRKKDIDKLERIQRRATKMIKKLRDLSYESRLLACGLTILETRRLRGDQIRPGAEVLSTRVLEYIFEVLVLALIEIMVMYSYSYSCSMYSYFTSTLRVHLSTF